MLQLAAILKAKTAQLEKEAWGHLVASLTESKTSDLWDLQEGIFGEISKTEGQRSPPPKRSHSEDEPPTRGSSPSLPTSISNITQPVSPKITVIFPMNESSLHDSGIKPEYLPVC